MVGKKQGLNMTDMNYSGTYKAALVVIGNEILTGRTQDTHTQWIGEKLLKHGIVLCEARTLPDNEDKIVSTVNALRAEFDYVFTTGGIGPTHDDITAQSIAKAFGVPIENNGEAYELLVKQYGADQVTPARARMALIPVGASLIPNPVSGAPGFAMENVYVMAGVPRIMHAMFDHVLDGLQKGKPVLSRTIMCGLPESVVAEKLSSIQAQYPGVEIGSYPNYRDGKPHVSFVLRSTDEASLEKATEDTAQMVRAHGKEPVMS
jgi:molybdenum cofactor synthesis domain-containing protein